MIEEIFEIASSLLLVAGIAWGFGLLAAYGDPAWSWPTALLVAGAGMGVIASLIHRGSKGQK